MPRAKVPDGRTDARQMEVVDDDMPAARYESRVQHRVVRVGINVYQTIALKRRCRPERLVEIARHKDDSLIEHAIPP